MCCSVFCRWSQIIHNVQHSETVNLHLCFCGPILVRRRAIPITKVLCVIQVTVDWHKSESEERRG